MPCACVWSGATTSDLQQPASSNPQLSGHISPRHTLHTHAYAALSRPREKHPRNSHLRRMSERETAGHSVVHLQTSAMNQRNWWRGHCQPSSRPVLRERERAGHVACTMQPPGHCTTQCRRPAAGVPRNAGRPLSKVRPSGSCPKVSQIRCKATLAAAQLGHRLSPTARRQTADVESVLPRLRRASDFRRVPRGWLG